MESSNATLSLTGVLVGTNTAGVNGGGVHVSGADISTITGATVSANTAGQEGGGLWNSADGTLTIDNSRVSFNTASGAEVGEGGGGIFNDGGTLNIIEAEIAANKADSDVGIGGGIANNGGDVTIMDATLITGNGPGGNAAAGLAATDVKIDVGAGEMTVREALAAYREGRLQEFQPA